MSEGNSDTDEVEQMRREFDHGFTLAESSHALDRVQLLAFRAGAGSFVVALEDLAEVFELRAVTRVPGQRAGSEGLAAVHGQLVAVYNLGTLLGAPGGGGAPRWLLVSRKERQVGFAVAAIDGYQEVSRSLLVNHADASAPGFIHQALVDGMTTRLVVPFSPLLARLRQQFAATEGGDR